jgi:DNA helicase-2/ATP-dependent DNA helicase PcrA
MIGISRSDFEAAVVSRKAGGKKGTAQFGSLVDLGIALEAPDGERSLLDLFEGFERSSDAYVFRREMFSAMRSALKTRLAGQSGSLVDALWHVQNRVRHAGRGIVRRSVGSTLLVKGLEFEHSIIVHSPSMNRKDWYVALTRATQSVTVLSPQRRFKLPD